MERITPHSVIICSLVSIYVKTEDLLPASRRFFSDYLIQEIKGIETCQDRPLSQVVTDLAQICCHDACEGTLSDHLLDSVEEIQASPDSLFDFLEGLSDLVTSDTNRENNAPAFEEVSTTSVLGLFLRRTSVLFAQTTFGSLCMLFDAFRDSIAAYRAWIEQEGEGVAGHHHSDSDSEQEGDQPPARLAAIRCFDDPCDIRRSPPGARARPARPISSLERARAYVHQLVERIQGANTCPSNIQIRIDRLQEQFPSLYQVHYLRYLLALRHQDIKSAEDHLHAYFDYHCAHAARSAPPNGIPMHYRMGATMSWAILNASVLAFSFGHITESYQAVQETIRIAHQHNERECLAFATAWLFHLSVVTGSTGLLGLPRLLDQSSSLGMPHLQSQGLATLAQRTLHLSTPAMGGSGGSGQVLPSFGMFSNLGGGRFSSGGGSVQAVRGETAPPVGVLWEALSKSEKLNVLHNLSDLTTLCDTSRANAWDHFGLTQMAVLFAKRAMGEQATTVQNEESSSGQPSSEHSAATTKKIKRPEDELRAATILANHLSGRGQYRSALELYLSLHSSYGPCTKLLPPTAMSVAWDVEALKLVARQSMRRHQLRKVECIVESLSSLSAYLSSQTLAVDLAMLRAEVHCANKQYQKAHAVVARAQGTVAVGPSSAVDRVRCMIAQADVFLCACKAAEAACVSLEALTTAHDLGASLLHAHAALVYAECRMKLGHVEDALARIQGVSSCVLSHGDYDLQSRLLATWAECIAMSTDSPSDPTLRLAMRHLDEAISLSRECENTCALQRALYLKARVCHGVGDMGERDSASAEFLEVSKARASFSSESPDLANNSSALSWVQSELTDLKILSGEEPVPSRSSLGLETSERSFQQGDEDSGLLGVGSHQTIARESISPIRPESSIEHSLHSDSDMSFG